MSRTVGCRLGVLLFVLGTGCASLPHERLHFEHAPIALAMGNEFVPGDTSPRPGVRGYNVPGRNPDSQMPWEFFLGHAAHRLIAYLYGVNYPDHRAFFNKETLVGILREEKLGDPSRLLPQERNLRPDITDVTTRFVFEIKPWNEQGLQEGRQECVTYVAALNRALLSPRLFTGGQDFHGEILIRFARGEFIWRLEWRTTVPGVTQYRWTRSQQRFASEAEAYRAAHWVDVTEQEMQRFGGWIAQAVDGMVDRREQLARVSGTLGVVIDVVGGLAVGIFSGLLLGESPQRIPSVRPPGQQGGLVVPLSPRGAPSTAPALKPTGSGR